MTNLHSLYFDEYALNFLTQFILILGMLFYFLWTRSRARQFWPPFLAFTGLAIFTGGELLMATAVWSRQYYALYFHYMGLVLGLLAGLSISYTFPIIVNDPFARQRKRELPIGLALFGIVFVLTVLYGIYQWIQLKPNGNPNLNVPLLDVGIVLLLAVSMTAYLRRVWALTNQSSPRRWGWQHLSPDNRQAVRVLYELTAVTLLFILLTSMMALVTLGLLPNWVRDVVPTLGMSLGLFLLSIAYLNATLEKTTFMVRIVGTTLLTVFLILGTIGMIVTRTYSDYIRVRPLHIPAQTVTITPQSTSSYTVTTSNAQFMPIEGEPQTATTLALPFEFPFSGQTWSQVDLSQTGVLAFNNWSAPLYAYNYLPAISFSQSEMTNYYTATSDDAIAITWIKDGSDEGVQIVLWRDGRFQLTTPAMSGDTLQRIGFQSGTGGTDFTPFDPTISYDNIPITADGLFTDYDILFHQALSPLMTPLVALVLLVSLLCIIGFPLMFQFIIIKPLRALVDGVRQVEAGNLDVEVPITDEDEIGEVTRNFNQMVAAVRDVELVLETEVVKRTQELAESQRQLGAVEERERIGREIHDDLGQVMGYIQMQGEAAAARLQRNEAEQAQTIITEMTTAAHEAHDRVRQYILGIRTGEINQPLDFWAALDAFLALARERYDLQIELTSDPILRTDWRLTPAVETQLLRIVQEGITNVYQHAHATLVQIIFSTDADWLTLILKDNGRGFDLTAVSSGHFGLKIMQERAESVNGRWQITSTPGEGTLIQLQLPCARKATTDGVAATWRVMLVDDHALFREGLGNMLRPHGLQIVGTATNGREAEALVTKLQPDLILMDIHMPEQDGLETTRRLKKQYPRLKIVMLTMAEDEALLLQALKYGASGYLLKNLPASQFLSLLNEVMAGKTIIAPSLATQALTALAQQDVATSSAEETAVGATLTERQQEVLACLAQGMTNKQIGEQLHISENTVKYHIRQMMERLQLETRHELIRYHLDS